MYYHDDAGKLCSLPSGWTSVSPVDPFVVLAAGRSPLRVADLLELFHPGTFFDPRDLMQVKYEMLRRVNAEGAPVTPEARGVPFLGSAEALRAGDEDLRQGVLGSGDGARSLGEALVVSRGMAAWMRAWAEIPPPKEKLPRERSDRDGVLPVAGRGEIATILAHMALGARQED